MKAIGLDIGTTSVSALVLDAGNGRVLDIVNVPNDARIPAEAFWERAQDPERIVSLVTGIVDELVRRYGPIGVIGVDGQMHGILYTDRDGMAVSPLYTWQDGRGNLPYQDSTYAEALSELSGYQMRSGYGLTTHFWNTVNGQIPPEAVCFCSIMDYVVMRLCALRAPVMHSSTAASFGMYSEEKGGWDRDAMEKAGIPDAVLPEVCRHAALIGKEIHGIPVACAIGDNQASFIGSVRIPQGTLLVNMGTGGQVSMLDGEGQTPAELERRPLNEGQRILVGSALCGGRAYAILEGFLRSCTALGGHADENLFEAMNAAGIAALREDRILPFDTRFCGTREMPCLRGSITGIGEDNFSAGALIGGCLTGMASEMYNLYCAMLTCRHEKAEYLVGSGNAIRKGPALRLALEKTFALELKIPAHTEEAAYGAALFGLTGAACFESLAQAQKMIRYI